MKKIIAITEVTVKFVEVDAEDDSQMTDNEWAVQHARLIESVKANYAAGKYADAPTVAKQTKIETIHDANKFMIMPPAIISKAKQAEIESACNELGI